MALAFLAYAVWCEKLSDLLLHLSLYMVLLRGTSIARSRGNPSTSPYQLARLTRRSPVVVWPAWHVAQGWKNTPSCLEFLRQSSEWTLVQRVFLPASYVCSMILKMEKITSCLPAMRLPVIRDVAHILPRPPAGKTNISRRPIVDIILERLKRSPTAN